MELPTLLIKEQPEQFDAWLERFIDEKPFAERFRDLQALLKLIALPSYRGRLRYELRRGSDLVIEIERRSPMESKFASQWFWVVYQG
jgi:hypothetical protein